MAKHLSRNSKKQKKKKDKSHADTKPSPTMPQVRLRGSQQASPRSDIHRVNVIYQIRTNRVSKLQTQDTITTEAAPATEQPTATAAAHPQQTLADHLATPKMLYEQCLIMVPRGPDLAPPLIDYSKRRFHWRLDYPSYFTAQDIQVPQGPYIFLACPNSPRCPCCTLFAAHYECPVLSIHGLCEKDHKNRLSSAGSVFLGPNNKHNLALPLKGDDRQTTQIAELSACIFALQLVNKNINRWKKERTRDCPSKLAMVVIKSDSPYIVNGASEYVWKWKTNGWKNCKGQPVANAEDWKILDALLEKLEQKIRVKFWLVLREENLAAENGAKAALGHGMDVCRVHRAAGMIKL